jgi:hypothetical protein
VLLLQAVASLGTDVLMALDVERIRFAETAAELTIDTKRGVCRIIVPCGTNAEPLSGPGAARLAAHVRYSARPPV